jgi:hypothetical protein
MTDEERFSLVIGVMGKGHRDVMPGCIVLDARCDPGARAPLAGGSTGWRPAVSTR